VINHRSSDVIIVHAIVKPAAASDGSAITIVRRQLLEPSNLQIPPSAIWIDLIETRRSAASTSFRTTSSSSSR
jgi:hypothetical protein